ncbi:MAG: type II toxin-antitoxin system VapC family toxin [Propionibacteriaceae bacterium]|nr:type II toxin-antitoxin system VapC family toxin [Propionibacteriaceae bacterium]
MTHMLAEGLTSESPTRGLVDTNILILRARIDPLELPEELSISAVTLAELSAGVHMVLGGSPEAIAERGRRLEILRLAEAEFDPLAFDASAARIYGQISAAVQAVGRTPRRRVADLMIAATAASRGISLFTTNPNDYVGTEGLVRVVSVRRP